MMQDRQKRIVIVWTPVLNQLTVFFLLIANIRSVVPLLD
jgi:hypothetical protein